MDLDEQNVILNSACRLVEVDLDVVEEVLRVLKVEGAVGVDEFAAEFGGDAGPEGARRDNGVFGDDGASGDDGAGADAGVVEDGGADADEDLVLDDAAVDSGVVADGDPVADDDRVKVALAVENGAVLDVGVGADADGVDVAAEDGIHPDGGSLAEDDVADELGGEIDVATGGNLGQTALVAADHGLRPLKERLFHFGGAGGRMEGGGGGG